MKKNSKRVSTILILAGVFVLVSPHVLADLEESYNTREDAVCTFFRDMSVGVEGEDVICLQDALKAKGYMSLAVTSTGYYGPITREAVKKWQSASGVLRTGYFGPLSRGAFRGIKSTIRKDVVEHDLYDIPKDEPVPTLDLILHKDAFSGWNAQIVTTNFVFAPERVSTPHVPGEGHAHIYVDGIKMNRVYGQWYHLGILPERSHMISVRLSTNDHYEYGLNGVRIEDIEHVVTER